MSDPTDHSHPHPSPGSSDQVPPPENADDAGTRALSDALRSSFVIIKIIMVILVIAFLGSGFFTVGTQEKAVILRLGKPLGTDDESLLGPGPHWAFPYPIDEVVKIPLGEVQTVSSTLGWHAGNPADPTQTKPPPAPALNPAADGYLLTADANIVHVRGNLRYRIRQPGLDYQFRFAQSSNSVLEAFNSALVFATARFTVDDILTRDAIGYREAVRQRLDTLIVEQGLSVTVDQLEISAVSPGFVAASFDAVGEAAVRRSTLINQAQSYANESISRSKAEAAARINTGENQRNLLVEFVTSEATNFLALLPAYQRNPELFMRQRQTETLQRIYTSAVLKAVVPGKSTGRPTQLRLQIDRPVPKPKIPARPAPAGGHKDEH